MNYNLNINGHPLSAQYNFMADSSFMATVGDKPMQVKAVRISDFQMLLNIDGKNKTVFLQNTPLGCTVMINGLSYEIEDSDLKIQKNIRSKSDSETSACIVPPMPSIVIRIMVSEGDKVKKSQPLIIVAAMKMETTLTAPYDGIVAKINVAEGDKVAAKQVLMDII